MAATLTLIDTIHNTQILEQYEQNKTDFYGIAVQGRRFTVVKNNDSLLSKVWFNIMTFLGFIYSDAASIENLKDNVTLYKETEEYKQSLTKLAGKHFEEINKKNSSLKKENELLNERLKKSEQITSEDEKSLHVEIAANRRTIEDQNGRIRKLNIQNQKLKEEKKRLEEKTKGFDQLEELEQKTKRIEELEDKIKKIETEKSKLKEKKTRYKHISKEKDKEIEEFKKEKHLFKKVWEHIKPGKNIEEYALKKSLVVTESMIEK